MNRGTCPARSSNSLIVNYHISFVPLYCIVRRYTKENTSLFYVVGIMGRRCFSFSSIILYCVILYCNGAVMGLLQSLNWLLVKLETTYSTALTFIAPEEAIC